MADELKQRRPLLLFSALHGCFSARYLQYVSFASLLFYYEIGFVCESVQSLKTDTKWGKYFSSENSTEWCFLCHDGSNFFLTAMLLFSAPNTFISVPPFLPLKKKHVFKRKGIRCFSTILITEVSVWRALESRSCCDSFSLLKISTRGFYSFFFFFPVSPDLHLPNLAQWLMAEGQLWKWWDEARGTD